MELHTIETPVESSGDLKISTFKIATSAKAFKILSSNLYSNKIRAVLRELSCNAYDSHVAAGCPEKPFDVHLPTRMNEQLLIRDYGVGLCHDDVMNLYTTYFASTKSNSNDYIGALGLGSKSPFAYTDTFGVTSYFDGVARTYAVFIKDGEPSITLVNEQPDTSPNGVEVSVPVDSSDISKFDVEADYVFNVFTVKPNMTGRAWSPRDFQKSSLFTTDTWFFGSHQEYSRNIAFAIMGNVIYPIKDMYMSDYVKSQSNILRSALFIYFPLGALDITPSREELSYDDVTIENIKTKIQEIDSQINVHYQNLVTGLTIRQKINKLRELSGRLRETHSPSRVAELTIGENLSDWESSLRIESHHAETQYHEVKQNGIISKRPREVTVCEPIVVYEVSRQGNITKSVNNREYMTISPWDDYVIVVANDLEGRVGINTVITQAAKECNTSQRYKTTIYSYNASDVFQKIVIDKILSSYDPTEQTVLSAMTLLASYKRDNPPVKVTRDKKEFITVLCYSKTDSTGSYVKFDSWKSFFAEAQGYIVTTMRSELRSVIDDSELSRNSITSVSDRLFRENILESDEKIFLLPREQQIRVQRLIANKETKLRDLKEALSQKLITASQSQLILRQLASKEIIQSRFYTDNIERLQLRVSKVIREIIYSMYEKQIKLEFSLDRETISAYNLLEFTSITLYSEKRALREAYKIQGEKLASECKRLTTTLRNRYPLLYSVVDANTDQTRNAVITADLLNYMEYIDNGCI